LITICALLGGLLALAVVVGVLCGHGAIDWSDVFSDAESVSSIIVFQGRIPRIILAIIVGAALGASGAAFQAIMRNPLADPFILGTSGGAALGGAVVLSLGIGAIAIGGTVVSVLPVAAFAGSLVALVVVYALATSKGRFSPVDVLLVGVVFNFFASAVVMFLKTLVTAEKAQDLLFWLMGSLNIEEVSDTQIGITGVLVLVGLVFLLTQAHSLNVLTLGQDAANHLGIRATRVRRYVFVATSIMIGAAVSLSGLIGFVGLIVPHAVRLVLGADHRAVIPASALAGGAFLVLCDALSRSMFPIFETHIPVGVVTAFIGGPVFVILLKRSRIPLST
jgi:iron complex transport system permease protein